MNRQFLSDSALVLKGGRPSSSVASQDDSERYSKRILEIVSYVFSMGSDSVFEGPSTLETVEITEESIAPLHSADLNGSYATISTASATLESDANQDSFCQAPTMEKRAFFGTPIPSSSQSSEMGEIGRNDNVGNRSKQIQEKIIRERLASLELTNSNPKTLKSICSISSEPNISPKKEKDQFEGTYILYSL